MHYKNIATLLRWIFTPVAIACLAYAVWQTRYDFAAILARADIIAFAAAILFWAASGFCSARFMSRSVSALAGPLSYRQACAIHIGRLPARYLPGGIWHTAARYTDLARYRVSHARLGTYFFLEHLLAVGIAFLLGGLGMLLFHNEAHWRNLGAIAALVAGAGLILGQPLLQRLIRSDSALTPGIYTKALLDIALFWLFAATAFCLYIACLQQKTAAVSWLQIGAAYLLSWGTGFVAVFAPQGLGVFEVIAAKLMNLPYGLAQSVSVILGFRLVTLMGDSCAYLLWRCLIR